MKASVRHALIGAASVAAVVSALAALAFWTAPTRASVYTYTAILGAANRQDVAAAQALCTDRYRRTHSLRAAPDGGLVGLPRNIHKNFQVWREGSNVWLCPTNRVGPVYQFVHESNSWRFDGPIGILQPGGRVERLEDSGMDEGLSDP